MDRIHSTHPFHSAISAEKTKPMTWMVVHHISGEIVSSQRAVRCILLVRVIGMICSQNLDPNF